MMRLVIVALATLTLPVAATAQSNTLEVSGMLMSDKNAPLTGTFGIQITMYDAQTGGNQTFLEYFEGVSVTDGYFSVILGTKLVPLAPAFEVEKQVWMQFQVKAGPGIPTAGQAALPRIPFTSVPWAFRAVRSSVADKFVSASSDPVTCNSSRKGYTYLNTSRSLLRYCDGAGFRDVAGFPVSGCSSGKLVKWNGSVWACATDLDTTYSASGSPVKLSGTVFSITNNSLKSTHIGDNQVSNVDFASNTLKGDRFADVSGADIADGAITKSKIANNAAIDISKFSGVAQAGHSHDSTYVNENQKSSITGSMIASGTIGGVEIANNTISGNKIRNSTIKFVDVDSSEIQKRVTGTCGNGKWVISVNADGTVNCAVEKTGDKGPAGDTGNKGATGDKGDKGNKGATGAGGNVGPTGPKGAKGNKGSSGKSGPTGPKGPQGNAGAKGAKGNKGAQGDAGPQGPKGDKGDNGGANDSSMSCSTYWYWIGDRSCVTSNGWWSWVGCPSGRNAASGGSFGRTNNFVERGESRYNATRWRSQWHCHSSATVNWYDAAYCCQ